MTTDPKKRTVAAISANNRRTQAASDRVQQALSDLRRDRAQITVAAVARRASVSRTFVYDNTTARAAVTAAAAQDARPPRRLPTADEQEATWRERALNAEEALKGAHTEIRTQRSRIGELLGQVRDLEAEWTQDSIQRITTENTTLKQRLRQLTTDHRTLEERLQAARSNLRFQDRRVADLEAHLADPLASHLISAARPAPENAAAPPGHAIPTRLPKNATDM